MEKRYVVIARCDGDAGETEVGAAGIRVWSEEFNSCEAADECAAWLNKSNSIRVLVVEDTPR